MLLDTYGCLNHCTPLQLPHWIIFNTRHTERPIRYCHSHVYSCITRGQFWPSGIVIACMCLFVHVSVCAYQSLACPRYNLRLVQARITKFGPKMQNNFVKITIVFEGNQPWSLRLYLTSKPKSSPFELVCTITHHPFKLGLPNLNQRCKIPWLRSLLF